MDWAFVNDLVSQLVHRLVRYGTPSRYPGGSRWRKPTLVPSNPQWLTNVYTALIKPVFRVSLVI